MTKSHLSTPNREGHDGSLNSLLAACYQARPDLICLIVPC
jgi:hypothetical protein